MNHKLILTDADYDKIESMTAIGMNDGDIAIILGISGETYGRMLKTDATLRDRKAKGKAMSNFKVLKTLHTQITREEVEKERLTIIKDEKGNEISRETKTVRHRKDPNARLLEFYLQTRMGFKKTTSLELTGANGDPIRMKLAKMSDEELEAELSKLDT